LIDLPSMALVAPIVPEIWDWDPGRPSISGTTASKRR
jgi:hypothetical protein